MGEFDKRLIPNYIAGLAIIFVFLGGFVYTLVNLDEVADAIIVEGDVGTTAVHAGIASSIVTAMIFIVKEVTTYLFRKNPTVVT